MNAKKPAHRKNSLSPRHAKKKVLIVDDDGSVRNAIHSVLKKAGYEVFQAPDGQIALAEFNPAQLDLVLLDLNLPSKSGWDIFEGFTSRNPTLPIIIITGQTTQSEMAAAAGVCALIEKPMTSSQLLQTIADVLNESPDDRLRRMCGYSEDGRQAPLEHLYVPAS